MTNNKVCRRCGEDLTDENWYLVFQKRNDCICKECNNEESRLYYEANRDKIKAQMRLYRKENVEKCKASYTQSARKKGRLPMSDN